MESHSAGTAQAPTACSFCGRPATITRKATAGHAVSLCGVCVDSFRKDIDQQQVLRARSHHHENNFENLRALYRTQFQDPRRERQFLASISFFATFALVRFIVRAIRSGRGPFHNVSAGGKHIHHLVWGILLLLTVGFVWLLQIGTGVLRPRRWMRATSILYGAGSALTLDEFALWLNLSDVYFTPEGRESIDAVFLFGSVLSIGFWGHPFLHSLARHVAKRFAAT